MWMRALAAPALRLRRIGRDQGLGRCVTCRTGGSPIGWRGHASAHSPAGFLATADRTDRPGSRLAGRPAVGRALSVTREQQEWSGNWGRRTVGRRRQPAPAWRRRSGCSRSPGDPVELRPGGSGARAAPRSHRGGRGSDRAGPAREAGTGGSLSVRGGARGGGTDRPANRSPPIRRSAATAGRCPPAHSRTGERRATRAGEATTGM